MLPVGTLGNVSDPAHRRWLAQGRLHEAGPLQEGLLQVLDAIGQPVPRDGLAALRLWGQSGARPDAWIAAADPVFLEAVLDRVRLHALGPDELPLPQVQLLFASLQDAFGDETRTFVSIETRGYLHSDEPLAAASASAEIVHLREPLGFLPLGQSARAHDALQSEMQMYLHAHPINDDRQGAGLPPINSLWLWGSGTAPTQVRRHIPPLFCDEPLITGYWHSCTGVSAPWPGSIEACLDAAGDGFVAVTDSHWVGEHASNVLEELRKLLSSGKLRQLTLLFRGGLSVELRRHHVLRFWRRVPELPTGIESL